MTGLSRQAANFFRNCGIGRGDRVLLMLPRVPQWWVAMLGLIRLGAVPVPATLLLTPREVAYRLKMAAIQAVITHSEGIAKVGDFDGIRLAVADTSSGTGRSSPVAWPGGWLDFDAGLAQAKTRFDRVRTGRDEPGILYFTSATTGEAKMVLHTQASYGLGHRSTGELWLDLKPGELHWNISDLGWAKAAWSSVFGPWHMGACVFALEAAGKFDPVLTLDTLVQFPIRTWCAPTTALRLIVRQDLSRFQSPTLRHCVTAGEPLNPEVLNLWRAATGLTLHEGFGQTETVALIANCPSLAYPVKPGSMESALLEHRAVLEVGVVGKPDPLRGQIVKAWVVLRPGVAAKEELKIELQAHCKKLVAAYKYPREIEFVAELPKTTSGKTRHFELRQASLRSVGAPASVGVAP